MYPRWAWNLSFFCFSLLCAGIIGLYHHTWISRSLVYFLIVKCKHILFSALGIEPRAWALCMLCTELYHQSFLNVFILRQSLALLPRLALNSLHSLSRPLNFQSSYLKLQNNLEATRPHCKHIFDSHLDQILSGSCFDCSLCLLLISVLTKIFLTQHFTAFLTSFIVCLFLLLSLIFGHMSSLFSPGLLETHCVDQGGLRLTLPLPSPCWD